MYFSESSDGPPKAGKGLYSKGAARPTSHILKKALKVCIILDSKKAVVRQVENRNGKGKAYDLGVFSQYVGFNTLGKDIK